MRTVGSRVISSIVGDRQHTVWQVPWSRHVHVVLSLGFRIITLSFGITRQLELYQHTLFNTFHRVINEGKKTMCHSQVWLSDRSHYPILEIHNNNCKNGVDKDFPRNPSFRKIRDLHFHPSVSIFWQSLGVLFSVHDSSVSSVLGFQYRPQIGLFSARFTGCSRFRILTNVGNCGNTHTLTREGTVGKSLITGNTCLESSSSACGVHDPSGSRCAE